MSERINPTSGLEPNQQAIIDSYEMLLQTHRAVKKRLEGEVSRLREVEKAANTLVQRLRFIHEDPQFRGVWTFAHYHHRPYTGPQYVQELNDLEKVLGAGDAPEKGDGNGKA